MTDNRNLWQSFEKMKGFYLTQMSDGDMTWYRASVFYPTFFVIPEFVIAVWHIKPRLC